MGSQVSVGLVLLAALALAAPIRAAGLELRSVVLDDQGVLFSLHRPDTGETVWLGPDKPYRGLEVIGYDDREALLIVSDHGRQVRLRLPDSLIASASVAEPAVAQAEARDPDAARRAAQAKIDLLKATLPESHPLHAKLLQAAKNELIAATVGPAPAESEATASQAVIDKIARADKQRRHIASGRQRNAVNSRIYAADHIAEFGLPDAGR